ncbi:serine hydrolase domain-containing protein [Spirillospora sp. NPDC048911]|uniref:serine hydrolase domain-containing protein n=1 Tax=Spirillospora sp. NPDC048911 TaxID=3364527 RepID=UPI00371608B1
MPAPKTRLIVRTVLGLILACCSLAAPAPPAGAARTAASAPAAACPTAGLGAFFDGALPGRLRDDHVPGAVVSVVSHGRTIFAKGYGSADVERGVAFDPAKSLVRIASITKVFTWTAVMQQVELGRLDLDTDVNRYLTAFKVPSVRGRPVTLRTLMNHTAGFEGQVVGTGARTSGGVPSLEDHLAHHMPALIRPPGEISAYSNYGAALAGHIVSRVSGEPYDRYVQSHLFAPLAMNRSTATEPVPAPLARDLARSYDSDARPPRRIPFTFDVMPPDGSVSTTATDMAHFMIAHLDGGRFGTRAVLKPETAARMHERSYAADPRLGGYAHGFMDRTINGHRVLMHDGSWEGFQSQMILVPGCDLGLFISTNGTGGVDTVTAVGRFFFDQFVPASAKPAQASSQPSPTPPTLRAEAAPRGGFYKPARHNESTVEKLLVLLGPARLKVDGDGTVRFKGETWRPQGNGFYTRADGRDHLVFLAGPEGRRYVATDGPAYQLMGAAETLPVNLGVLLVFVLAALSALAVPLARLRRRPRSSAWRIARSLAASALALGLAFLVLLFVQVLGDTSEFLYGVPFSFRALLVLPVVVVVMTACASFYTVKAWRGSGAGLTARVHQIGLLTGLLALTWFAWQWNLGL